MRSRIPLVALLMVAGSLALPLAAYAAIPFFGPIIPQSTNQCAAGWGLIMVVINNIISLGITLAIVFVAPLMIAYAGFLFVVNPVNAGGKAKAKSILLNTVVGIVIALAGWMIVDAVMAVLYNPQKPGETWSQLITTGGANFCIPLAGSLRPAVVPPPVVVVPGVPASETAIRQQFASANVGINHPEPCNPYNANGVLSGCTNVGGLREATVSQVVGIKNSCGGCSVIVTGGSEAGHAPGQYSHGAGYKVDLGLNAALNAFLERLPLTGERGGDSGGPIRADTCGNQYVKESNHWDITVYRTCTI